MWFNYGVTMNKINRIVSFMAVFCCIAMMSVSAYAENRQQVFFTICGPETCLPDMRPDILTSTKELAGLTMEQYKRFRVRCAGAVDTSGRYNITIYAIKPAKKIEFECSNVFGTVMAREGADASSVAKRKEIIEQFNVEQRNRAFGRTWLLERQSDTNDCVYFMGRHLAAALGKNPDAIPRGDDLAEKFWDSGFSRWGIDGESARGLSSWDGVLKTVERGVNDGKLVVLNVTPAPINREIAKKQGVSVSGGTINHVIRVLGTHLGPDGKIDALHVYDSAGYTPTYTVSADAVQEAYEVSVRENFRNVFNRGVFVSKERVLAPVDAGTRM